MRERTLAGAKERSERLRLAVEKTQRRIVDLRQGLITAQAIERERKSIAGLKGDVSAKSAIAEGEAVLQRLLDGADPVEQMEVLEEIESDLSGQSVFDRMSAAGFGKSDKVNAEEVLARLSAEVDDAETSPSPGQPPSQSTS